MAESSKLLINEPPLHISKSVATDVGVRAATVLAAINAFSKDGMIDHEYLRGVVYFIKRRAFGNYVAKLLDRGYIAHVDYAETEIIRELRNKRLFLLGIGIGRSGCLLCGGLTYILHEHHLEDKSTIMICPNCHYEFHFLKRRRLYRLLEERDAIR